MDRPPLTLRLTHLSPSSLYVPDPDEPPRPVPVPIRPEEQDEEPPTLSAVHNYAGPYPSASLGSTLGVVLNLRNTSDGVVKGVRMMCEVQSPGGRYRLGEVIHGQEPALKAAASEEEKEEESEVKERVAADGGEGAEGEKGDASVEMTAPVDDPELAKGEDVKLDVSSEMKELGQHIIICSVAWETPDGRRTFQRFLKFNVTPPLAIKTRIYTSPNPNSTLDAIAREYIYLEILMQNISFQGMVFDRVLLEAVHGLQTRPLDDDDDDETSGLYGKEVGAKQGVTGVTLMPGDTRQQLFKLAPIQPSKQDMDQAKDTESAENKGVSDLPKSSFLPVHPPGSILPLGRLDLAWRSGRTHDKGRLQTSTLNRRIPNTAPAQSAQPPVPRVGTPSLASHTPSRPSSSVVPSPAQGSVARMGSPRPSLPPKDDTPLWEFDLILKGSREVRVEDEFSFEVRVGVRSMAIDEELDDPKPPTPLRIGVQYLTRPPPPPPPPLLNVPLRPGSSAPTPDLAGGAPASGSRTSTPQLSRPPTVPPVSGAGVGPGHAPGLSRSSTMTASRPSTSISRPFSPLSSPPMSASQPMTPVATQLRRASAHTTGSPKIGSVSKFPTTADLPPLAPQAPFPPPPYLSTNAAATSSTNRSAIATSTDMDSPTAHLGSQIGRVHHLGNSLQVCEAGSWTLVEERMGTTYADPIAPARRWEVVHTVHIRFLALDEGLAGLGGMRILVFDDEKGTSGSIGREWDSLGSVWVTD